MGLFKRKKQAEARPPEDGLRISVEVRSDNVEKGLCESFPCGSYEEARRLLPEKAKELSEKGRLVYSMAIAARYARKGETAAETRIIYYNEANEKSRKAVAGKEGKRGYAIRLIGKDGRTMGWECLNSRDETLGTRRYAGELIGALREAKEDEGRQSDWYAVTCMESMAEANSWLYGESREGSFHGDRLELYICRRLEDGAFVESTTASAAPKYSMPCAIGGLTLEGGMPDGLFGFRAEKRQTEENDRLN